MCVAASNYPVMDSRAPLSGVLADTTLIPSLPSFDSAVYSTQAENYDPILIIKNVTYDKSKIYMPGCGPTINKNCIPLTDKQKQRIHPYMYVTTNSIDPTFSQKISTPDGASLNEANFYVALTTGEIDRDGKFINVFGWGVLNGNNHKHPWSPLDQPSKIYDQTRTHYNYAVAALGSATGLELENYFVSYDPEKNPNSLINYITLKEYNYFYHAHKNNQATLQGVILSYDCSHDTSSKKCYHPTMDSTALIINGTNLPNAIQVTVPSWANEYKGYNFYIPGSNAPGVGTKWDFQSSGKKNSSHSAFESFTPTLNTTNQLIFRAWVEQSNNNITPSWKDYSLNFGEIVDGDRWDPSASTGSNMGQLSFNWNQENLGGVCLIGNQNTHNSDKETPGICVRGDSTSHFGENAFFERSVFLESKLNIGSRMTISDDGLLIKSQDKMHVTTLHIYEKYPSILAIDGNKKPAILQTDTLQAINYTTKNPASLFLKIISSPHQEGDRVWCHDCLNFNQLHNQGTGRWIFLDSKQTWRSDDGKLARY